MSRADYVWPFGLIHNVLMCYNALTDKSSIEWLKASPLICWMLEFCLSLVLNSSAFSSTSISIVCWWGAVSDGWDVWDSLSTSCDPMFEFWGLAYYHISDISLEFRKFMMIRRWQHENVSNIRIYSNCWIWNIKEWISLSIPHVFKYNIKLILKQLFLNASHKDH